MIAVMLDAVLSWYSVHARDLPWRAPDRTPWGVLVSEIMLQQTPVSRVKPTWHMWMTRWPTPTDLADEPPAEAIRAWGRLGYPRRALRLHAAAKTITDNYQGRVPSSYTQLLTLPGVGEYTAAAVASFAFGQRHAVLDTNVRRVFARALTGKEYPPTATTVAERRLAASVLPDPPNAPRWSVAVMELGALVCTARRPRCNACPLSATCAWRLAGSPSDEKPRHGQAWHGTDRQARGRLMAVLRAANKPVSTAALEAAWPAVDQRNRALAGLVTDGLIEPVARRRYRLPGADGE